jgi:hypothetical protein
MHGSVHAAAAHFSRTEQLSQSGSQHVPPLVPLFTGWQQQQQQRFDAARLLPVQSSGCNGSSQGRQGPSALQMPSAVYRRPLQLPPLLLLLEQAFALAPVSQIRDHCTA